MKSTAGDFLSHYSRVSPDYPCPVCHKPDWCLIRKDGGAALCQRTPSAACCGDAGWFHAADCEAPPPGDLPPERLSPETIARLMAKYQACDPLPLHRLSLSLGVSLESLTNLGVGWTGNSWAFPMWAGSRMVGIRFRGMGMKWSLKGGRNGLFLPATFPEEPEQVFVCEGPTDTAVMLDHRLPAVGRPSCNSGGGLLRKFLGDTPAIIVADNDMPGIRGAIQLGSLLNCQQIIAPTYRKDARDVARHGGSLQHIIEAMQGNTNAFWRPVTTEATV